MKNKKGFSLIELVVAFVILVILTVSIAPAVVQNIQMSNLKTDNIYASNLTSTIKTAAQSADMYKEVKRVTTGCKDDSICLEYEIDKKRNLVFKKTTYELAEGTSISDADVNDCVQKLLNYVNSTLETKELKEITTGIYKITIKSLNLDGHLEITGEWEEDEE